MGNTVHCCERYSYIRRYIHLFTELAVIAKPLFHDDSKMRGNSISMQAGIHFNRIHISWERQETGLAIERYEDVCHDQNVVHWFQEYLGVRYAVWIFEYALPLSGNKFHNLRIVDVWWHWFYEYMRSHAVLKTSLQPAMHTVHLSGTQRAPSQRHFEDFYPLHIRFVLREHRPVCTTLLIFCMFGFPQGKTTTITNAGTVFWLWRLREHYPSDEAHSKIFTLKIQ